MRRKPKKQEIQCKPNIKYDQLIKKEKTMQKLIVRIVKNKSKSKREKSKNQTEKMVLKEGNEDISQLQTTITNKDQQYQKLKNQRLRE
jgi:hypothetical protein